MRVRVCARGWMQRMWRWPSLTLRMCSPCRLTTRPNMKMVNKCRRKNTTDSAWSVGRGLGGREWKNQAHGLVHLRRI